MFDFGWTEILIILMVAVIVIGPKEIPATFRQLGLLYRNLRNQINNLRFQLDELVDSTEVKNLKNELHDIKSNLKKPSISDKNKNKSTLKDKKPRR